jgi:outer membrane protein OmpA-like peptidoglycan-associated protein/tetratricopeptide (TPR) repeat protein
MKLENYKKVFFLGSLLFFLACHVNAQSIKSIEKLAKSLFKLEDYNGALIEYLALDSLNSNNPEYKARIGICYLYSETKNKALPYLQKARQGNYAADNIDFHLGRAYHLGYDFDKAISFYESSLKKQKPGKDDNLIKIINRQIEMCKNAMELMKNPIDVKIENIGPKINSPYPDYVPVISADEQVLIFTSRRPNTTGGKRDEYSNQFYEDIYISYKDSSGEWGDPEKIGKNINTDGHDASIALSPDGQTLFIYKDDGAGDIYKSISIGNRWSNPKKMGGTINLPKSWEPSATISSDEKILFFTSDRPGGFGGRDLYITKLLPNGQWSDPKNLGPNINTEYDEDAPFIHPDGKTLYFSSKGHKSMGGFDIFTSEYFANNDSLSPPVNIGYPINTVDDDIFFVWSADGSRGYYSSVREDGYGEKDIYVVSRPKPKVSLIVLKGKVFSEKNNSLPLGAVITVTDNETNEIVGVFNSNSHSGRYVVILPPGKNYGINVETPGYLHYSENVFIPQKSDYHEIIKNFNLEPLEKGSRIVLKNVFFDHDKAELRKESFSELDRFVKLLKENKHLFIEIAGHTDEVGDNKYNQKLSERRSTSVVEYLANKGIERKRLYPLGYGEDFFVAPNDTEANRQLNRRTELIIVDELAPGKTLKDRKGFYYLLKESKK